MKEDILRKSYELALQAGRTQQHKDTGFIHKEMGIPFVENSLFCLALFRSKTHEAIQEAKVLLDKLLYFQQMDETLQNLGNFPIYLHEYPFCRDHYTAANAAHALVLIQKDFGAILGDVLRKRLAASILAASAFARTLMDKESLPLWMRVKTLALTGETGDFSLLDMKQQDYSAEAVGHMLAASYMVTPTLSNNWLYQYFEKTFYAPAKAYIGPAFYHYHIGLHPKISIYDFMAAVLSQGLPEQAVHVLPQQPLQYLQAALAVPCEDVLSLFAPGHMDGHCGDIPWRVVAEKNYGISWIEQKPQIVQPGFYPVLCCIEGRVITLQARQAEVHCQPKEKSIEINIDFSEECFSGDEERKKVLSVIIPDDAAQFVVNGKTASTYALEDAISVAFKNRSIQVRMLRTSGDASLFGNIGPILRSNNTKSGDSAVKSYDREIALRLLSGTSMSLKILIDL